jgi:hypothetical protein
MPMIVSSLLRHDVNGGWWTELAGVIAFAVLLSTSFIVWKRNSAATGNRAYDIALFSAGFIVLVVGLCLIVAAA